METSREERDLQALAVELPEDIVRLKEAGELELAAEVIDERLKKDLPRCMRKRLLLEKEILAQLPMQYPYDWETALELLRQNFRDFQEEELRKFLLEGAFEWIYRNGRIHLKDNFIANLVKTREELADRVIDRNLLQAKLDNFRMLDRVIARMKEQGKAGCRFRIRSMAAVKPDMQRPGRRIQIQFPLPLEYSQVKSFRLLGTEPSCAEVQVAPPQCDQRTICLTCDYQAGQEFAVEYEFTTEAEYWDWRKAESERGAMASETSGAQLPETYLSEQLPHIRFTPYLRALVKEVVGEETDPLRKAKRIYDYITTHVMYSFVRSYFTIPQQVTYIASGMKGDCGLQALFFITMCRIAGVPAGWQSGLYASPLSIGCHDWAQFYVEPYGWLYADCSFGGAAYRAGDLERWEFYFGNLEPYRLPAAREYQKDFCFPKQYLRRDPYDNQMGEAEYEDMGLLVDSDVIVKHEIVQMDEW